MTRACAGRSRTSSSASTRTSRSSPKSKTCAVLLSAPPSLPGAHAFIFLPYPRSLLFPPRRIATFGHRGRIHRLGHQFRVSPRQAPWWRYVRSEGLAAPSWFVFPAPSPPAKRAHSTTWTLPMIFSRLPPRIVKHAHGHLQNVTTIFGFLVSHRT